MKSLKGVPKSCYILDCSYNNLESLKYVTYGNLVALYCQHNNLKSLKYAHDSIKYFNCSENKLTSLEGAPQKCNNFDCSSNTLTSLEYAPKEYNKFDFNNWDSIKKITFKEPIYILKLLKEKRIDLF